MSRDECQTCHRLMDPIGFGLEGYDAIGRYRETENGQPIDDSGEVLSTRDIDGAFVGARALGESLAPTAEVSDCVAKYFFRFVLGRLESSADRCELERVERRFSESDGRLMELLVAILDTTSFHYRTAEGTPGEAP
jgi:hypothetical protein